jgi:transcriptional regulator with XRE-family HTH domain
VAIKKHPENADLRGRLRTLIKADGRTIERIAADCRVGPSTIYLIMAGTRADPKASTLQRLLDGLNKTWSDLD